MNQILISDSIDGAHHRLVILPGLPFERLLVTELERGFDLIRIKGLGRLGPKVLFHLLSCLSRPSTSLPLSGAQ